MSGNYYTTLKDTNTYNQDDWKLHVFCNISNSMDHEDINIIYGTVPRLVVTLNIKLIYISKNSKKNVLKQYSVSKLYSLFHGLHLLLAEYVISLFFVCNSCHVAWTWQKSSSVNEFYVITSIMVDTTFVILLSLEWLQAKNIRLKLMN